MAPRYSHIVASLANHIDVFTVFKLLAIHRSTSLHTPSLLRIAVSTSIYPRMAMMALLLPVFVTSIVSNLVWIELLRPSDTMVPVCIPSNEMLPLQY